MSGWDELADGVFRRRYAELDQNIGLVVGDDDLLVIDSRSHPHHGRLLREHIGEVSTLPVRWLVNTHWHWDHCFGNAAFPAAAIVGHDRCRRGLLERGRSQLDRLKAAAWFPADEVPWLEEVEILPPTLTFEERTAIRAASHDVELSYHGWGHTDSDIVVSVGDVSFVGDLVEEGSPPVFDDGYPRAWVATLRSIVPGLRPVVVPGHGGAVDPGFVVAQSEAIEAAVHGTASPFPPEVMDVIALRLDAEDRGTPLPADPSAG